MTPQCISSAAAFLVIVALVLGGGGSFAAHALQQDASHHALRDVAAEAAGGGQLGTVNPTYCMPDGDEAEMTNIRAVLNAMGYTETEDPLQATLLWYTGHPFRSYCPYLSREQLAQLLARLRQQDPAPANLVINSHPGLLTITSKAELAALSGTLPFLPRSFQLPAEYQQWQAFINSDEGAGMQWLQKGFGHAGIQLLPDPRAPELAGSRILVQQHIKPFLAHKRLWDIGLFVSITSVDPLVAYIQAGTGVVRFTLKEFDASLTPDTDPDAYVISKRRLPLDALSEIDAFFRGIPTASQPLAACLDLLHSCGVNTTDLMLQAQSQIVQVLAAVNAKMREAEREYPAARTNSFMWTRFDFILSEDHKLYMIEANMSPGIGIGSDPLDTQMWREQIAYDVITLNGLGPGGLHHPGTSADLQRLVADPLLLDVEEPACAGTCRDDCSSTARCALCHACRDARQNRILQRLQAEASGEHHFRRVYPPPQHLAAYMQGRGIRGPLQDLEGRPDNVLVATWLQAKCGLEPRFC